MKDLIKKLKWILLKSKAIFPFLIFTIVMNTILSLIGVYNALVSKSLIDSAISKDTSAVIKWLIIMGIIIFSNMAIRPLISLFSTHTSIRFNQSLQKDMYNHITYSKSIEQSKFHSVSLLTRITNDVDTISSVLISTIPSIVSLTATLIASFATLIYLSPAIAMIAVIIGPFLVLISKIFGSKLKILYKLVQEEDVKYRSFIQETLNNIMIVKTFCFEKNNMNTLNTIQKNKYDLSMKNTKISLLSSLSMSFASSVVYFSIFCYGALNISKGLGTYGSLTAMLQLYSNIQGPFSSLAGTYPKLINALAATERLMDIENLPLEDTSQVLDITKMRKPLLKFNNVSFSYDKNKSILKDLNLNINPGETIAFVGPSGEGKTTIIKLLLSLIDSDSGEILVEGNDSYIENLNRNHRELISYVPQGNTLFSGTIMDNLKYGKADATTSEIEEATKSACALNFINDLKDGFNTLIKERGNGISEGQAQRISIARAFIRKKPILILDEATSALDPETEVKVLKSVKNLSHKPTCIIITHRPSALSICDKVIRLENGYLHEVDKKTFNNLIKI
ncbi:ABC transporter ATP-binding protein [Clostridium sardiniense]|uniref:ABC transporter ATP-binding protein n=1 Tax=Clostridium sardiniense TaxID=29369 RepID=UPI003D3289E1